MVARSQGHKVTSRGLGPEVGGGRPPSAAWSQGHKVTSRELGPEVGGGRPPSVPTLVPSSGPILWSQLWSQVPSRDGTREEGDRRRSQLWSHPLVPSSGPILWPHPRGVDPQVKNMSRAFGQVEGAPAQIPCMLARVGQGHHQGRPGSARVATKVGQGRHLVPSSGPILWSQLWSQVPSPK